MTAVADIMAVDARLPALLLAAVRPGAALLSAPLFSAVQVPIVLRLILALAIGVAFQGAIVTEAGVLLSLSGLVMLANEVVIGLALGFALQTGFAAASVAGELIANAMGLGFAAMIDPFQGRSTSVVSQTLAMVATTGLLAMNGHLAFIAIVGESMRIIPPGTLWMPHALPWNLALLGGAATEIAISIALPVITGVIMIHIAMAFLARTAPALNLFAVGLPAALLGGLLLFTLAMPAMSDAVFRGVRAGLDFSQMLLPRAVHGK